MHCACSCYFEVKCCPLSCFLKETLKTELRLVLLLLVKLIHVVPVLLKSLIVFQESLPFLLLPLNLFLQSGNLIAALLPALQRMDFVSSFSPDFSANFLMLLA